MTGKPGTQNDQDPPHRLALLKESALKWQRKGILNGNLNWER
jgi:hypothetical protein